MNEDILNLLDDGVKDILNSIVDEDFKKEIERGVNKIGTNNN